MLRRPRLFLLVTTVASLATAGRTHAAPQDVSLNFSSLPSAQGWVYSPTGSHTGAIESAVYSVSGGTFRQNSIGQGFGVSGGSIFYNLNGIVTATETKQLRVTARCLQVEGSGGGAAGQQGFAFGFTTGTVQYDVSITPTNIYTLAPSGTVNVAGTYNNTVFQEYTLDFTPPSTFRIYRAGVLVHTGTNGFAVAANRVFIGDGTGGANARAEVTALRFVQSLATPTTPSSWGRVKSLYR
jgi:hypothetical protein